MITFKILERLTKMNECIQRKNTGSPSELAKKMKVSERCIRRHITILKELGAPIGYSKKYNSYYYKEEGYFCFEFIKIKID